MVFPSRSRQHFKQACVGFDVSLFDVKLLVDEATVGDAIRIFENALANPAVNIRLIVEDLLSAKNLFEFVVSGKFTCVHDQHGWFIVL